MTHTEIIRALLNMKRDPTGDYWCATTPRGYTAYYHVSGMAAIVMSWY